MPSSVDEDATVNTFFMRLFGLNQAHIHVRATACSPCGVKPLDIVLVLDRTGSMCQDSAGKTDPACTDLNNARNGMKTFLSYLDPTVDSVGLAVLPPATSMAREVQHAGLVELQLDDRRRICSCRCPRTTNCRAALSTRRRISSRRSTASRAAGRTSYANAIEAAQAELNAHGRPGVQEVIVFLSDGAANLGPTYYPTTSPYRTQPCHQGVTSAGYSKAAGTLVYSIGYALADDTGGCTSYTGTAEQPAITVTQALQSIATNPGNFYNQPTPGQLNTIYTAIAADVTQGTSALTSDTTP